MSVQRVLNSAFAEFVADHGLERRNGAVMMIPTQVQELMKFAFDYQVGANVRMDRRGFDVKIDRRESSADMLAVLGLVKLRTPRNGEAK